MRFGKLMRFTLMAALLVGIALAAVYREQFSAAALQSWMQDAGVAAPLIFMALYAVATVLFLPGSILTIAGGALFGPVWGTFYSLTGATLGATLAFLVARYLASDWVARKAGGRLKQLIEGVEAEGWRFIAFVRLVPLFPLQSPELCAGADTHQVVPLYRHFLHLHAAGGDRLHLSGLCRTGGGCGQRRKHPEGIAGARLAGIDRFSPSPDTPTARAL